jgi:hypothetical protein
MLKNGKNMFLLESNVSVCMHLIVSNRKYSYCTVVTITDIARKACGSVPLTVFLVRALRE